MYIKLDFISKICMDYENNSWPCTVICAMSKGGWVCVHAWARVCVRAHVHTCDCKLSEYQVLYHDQMLLLCIQEAWGSVLQIVTVMT
jgi:hypothetical protein